MSWILRIVCVFVGHVPTPFRSSRNDLAWTGLACSRCLRVLHATPARPATRHERRRAAQELATRASRIRG